MSDASPSIEFLGVKVLVTGGAMDNGSGGRDHALLLSVPRAGRGDKAEDVIAAMVMEEMMPLLIEIAKDKKPHLEKLSRYAGDKPPKNSPDPVRCASINFADADGYLDAKDQVIAKLRELSVNKDFIKSLQEVVTAQATTMGHSHP